MGMVGCFAAASADTLAKLKADPSLVDECIHPNDGEDVPPYYIQVDKAWHGIHYLLTGTADGGEEPFSLAVLGGEGVGDDVGYGPARILTPEQVRQVAQALGQISEQQFRERFAPKAMEAADIYPKIIWVRDGEKALDYLVHGYRQMIVFYRDAAARGDGAILWLT
jgi:hypothetical protein